MLPSARQMPFQVIVGLISYDTYISGGSESNYNTDLKDSIGGRRDGAVM